MSEDLLTTLRQLRERARELLKTILTDLGPFVKDDGTFRRKPDSLSIAGDINVTTTCSCLMALASTNNFKRFYKTQKISQSATEIFLKVVKAPWMSSGLTANNAFTTTLVIRTLGFLEEQRLFEENSKGPSPAPRKPIKAWELHLGIKNVFNLAKKLREHRDLADRFLWLSLSDTTRAQLSTVNLDQKDDAELEKSLKTTLALGLRRILESGWIYEESRFQAASHETKAQLAQNPTGYALAEVNRLLLIDQYPDEFARIGPISLQDIARSMAEHPNNFSINEYPPSTAVVYWFVDGIHRAQISLFPDQWTRLCTWATKEFNHERSLVVAEHDATMDPIAMGMAACLCARLRAISEERQLGTGKSQLAILPSMVELERSIEELIAAQTKSGIFHKYFPMFHYQDAGSNFCFTFELLEAVLNEFCGTENKLLAKPDFLHALEKAVGWCENRLKSEQYTGWNSGGDLNSLRKEYPESWATAVVHMFLWELTTKTSERIQQEILHRYKARLPKERSGSSAKNTKAVESSAFDGFLDIEVLLKGKPDTLSSVLKAQFVENYRTEDERSLRRNSIENKPRSALLFGPPGTSKTRIIKALAADLNWPLLELTPTDFVKGTLANVYLQTDKIFEDLLDLSGVVVFFDEMDALVQTREGDTHLDIESQFLTTTMLPKLTRLYDQAQVIFFMATNFQDRFDAAIKRPGRFDLLLCIGPPRLTEKIKRLHRFYGLDHDTAQTTQAVDLIKKYLKKSPKITDQLELYTFGEFETFLKGIATAKEIGNAVKKLRGAGFRKRVKDDSRYVILKLSDLDPLRKIGVKWKRLFELDKKKFTVKEVQNKKLQPTYVIRYFCDRRESKEQYLRSSS